MNLENPHVDFVIAAYTVAFVGLSVLAIHTILKWRGAKKREAGK